MISLRPTPPLVDPVLVAAFMGWNDAGDAASAAVDHLDQMWSATLVGQLDPEDYYDFQVNRPTVVLDDNDERTLLWPTTRLSVAHIPLAHRDLVLVHGVEPSMRWGSFCSELLDAAETLGVREVVTLGALLADTPHTRPVPVVGSSLNAAVRQQFGWEASRYEGPTGIVGVLGDAAHQRGLSVMSLWASVPHYVAQPPCPKATLALLNHLEDILDVPVPLGDLPDEARAWQIGVEELANADEEIADYVRALEEQQDTTDLPEASGESIAKEFERYLRRRAQGA